MSKLIVEQKTVSSLIPVTDDISDKEVNQIVGNYSVDTDELTISASVLEDMIYKLPYQDKPSPREAVTLPLTAKYDGFITFKTKWENLLTNMSVTINGKTDIIRHYPCNFAIHHNYEVLSAKNNLYWYYQDKHGEMGYCVPIFKGDVIETTTPDVVYDIYAIYFKERTYNAR